MTAGRASVWKDRKDGCAGSGVSRIFATSRFRNVTDESLTDTASL